MAIVSNEIGELGIDRAQGYHIGAPEPFEALCEDASQRTRIRGPDSGLRTCMRATPPFQARLKP